MRTADSVETRFSCPACRGTGHSGNLHDETCAECDGSRRLVVTIGQEQQKRYAEDAHYHAAAHMLARLLTERGFTPADLKGIVDVGLALCAHWTKDRPWPIEPVPYNEAYEKMREFEAMLIAQAAGLYPTSSVLVHDGSGVARGWTCTSCRRTFDTRPGFHACITTEPPHTGVDDGPEKSIKRRFIDTDREWP